MISADRTTKASAEQILAMHTIAGALSMHPEGQDAEIAKVLERVLQAQASSGQRFSNDSVWTLVSAVGHIQARLDRLRGLRDTDAPGDLGEVIEQLLQLASDMESGAAAAPQVACRGVAGGCRDPGRSARNRVLVSG